MSSTAIRVPAIGPAGCMWRGETAKSCKSMGWRNLPVQTRLGGARALHGNCNLRNQVENQASKMRVIYAILAIAGWVWLPLALLALWLRIRYVRRKENRPAGGEP
jgi:hypothetical protein